MLLLDGYGLLMVISIVIDVFPKEKLQDKLGITYHPLAIPEVLPNEKLHSIDERVFQVLLMVVLPKLKLHVIVVRVFQVLAILVFPKLKLDANVVRVFQVLGIDVLPKLKLQVIP